MNGLKPLVVLVLVVTLILQIVSLGTHFWATATFRTTDDERREVAIKGSIGLWKRCETKETTGPSSAMTSSERKCEKLLSQYETDRLKLARALVIISIFGALPSGVAVVVTCLRRSPSLLMALTIVTFLQAVLQGVGVGMAVWWLDMFSVIHQSHGWSLYLGASVSLLYFLAGVLGCMSYRVECRSPYPAVYREDGAQGVSYIPMLSEDDK